ncbi:MAG: STAS domain-containing protein [Desulfobulbaceae bacterium]|nr:STAS domain-containing protein [Desulfobulbaceae bacterium]
MENPTLNSSGQVNDEIVISSGKRLTIETIADFTQRIRQGLSGSGSVVVAFDADVEVDITVLQVLCSACKTARAEGKTFSSRNGQPKALADLIAACGVGACGAGSQGHCKQFGDGGE